MQLTDINGNIYGFNGLEITGIDGKPKVPVIPSTLIVNSTPITGGAVGRILFEGAGNVLQESSNLFWDSVNNRLGIGTTTPSTSLTIFGTNELVQIGDGTAANFSYISFNGSRSQVGYKTTGLHLLTSSGRSLVFGSGSFSSTTEWARFALTTGNLLLGTITDAGYKLDVNGSVRTTGSISAASAIARGTYLNQTLVATANNDVLAGLDIAPTFTTGSFTGVTGASLRVNSSIIPSFPGAASLGAAGLPFNNAFFNSIVFSNTYQNYNGDITFSLGYVNTARFFSSTKNFLIQNGGTFVDAGYRLDVNGTTRLQSTLLVSGATTTTGLITANGGINSSLNGYGVTVAANSFFSNDTTRLSQSPATWIWHDLFAFNRYNATYETYNGTTWSSATLNTELFAQKQTQSIQVINTTILASRWTFNGTGWGTGQWLVIGVAWDASIATYNVLLESYDGTAWVTRHTSNSSVAANNYFAYVTAYSGDNQLRVTITRTGGGNNLNISNIKLLTARPGDQGVGSDVEFPYYWNGTRSIGIGTSSVINASAILDVGSTTKGFLPPRMSNAQMLAIASPAAGLIVYDTTSQKHFGYNGSSWNAFF